MKESGPSKTEVPLCTNTAPRVTLISSYRPCIRLDRCVHVLEKFLQRGALAEVIWEVCQQQLEPTPTPVLHEAVLTKICSLPDHVANCLQSHNKAVFFPKNYYPRVGNAMLSVLQMVSISLRGKCGPRENKWDLPKMEPFQSDHCLPEEWLVIIGACLSFICTDSDK